MSCASEKNEQQNRLRRDLIDSLEDARVYGNFTVYQNALGILGDIIARDVNLQTPSQWPIVGEELKSLLLWKGIPMHIRARVFRMWSQLLIKCGVCRTIFKENGLFSHACGALADHRNDGPTRKALGVILARVSLHKDTDSEDIIPEHTLGDILQEIRVENYRTPGLLFAHTRSLRNLITSHPQHMTKALGRSIVDTLLTTCCECTDAAFVQQEVLRCIRAVPMSYMCGRRVDCLMTHMGMLLRDNNQCSRILSIVCEISVALLRKDIVVLMVYYSLPAMIARVYIQLLSDGKLSDGKLSDGKTKDGAIRTNDTTQSMRNLMRGFIEYHDPMALYNNKTMYRSLRHMLGGLGCTEPCIDVIYDAVCL